MVPNSLGPAELLLHYGTDDQKNRHLPRLAFRFNRRSAGRLRQMVDLINDSLGVTE